MGIIPPFLICCEQTLCLLATRCVAKTFVLVFVIVGIAAPQVTVSSGSNDTAFFLTKITSKTGGVSVEISISYYFSLFSCDAGTAMCNASLAMGIIAILCAAAGIELSVATKFLPFNIPKLVIFAVAAAESVTALIGFAIAASVFNGGACDGFKVGNIPDAKYGGGFALFIVGWIASLVDVAIETLVYLGQLGSQDATPSTTAHTEHMMSAMVRKDDPDAYL